jgi:tetratricopeptide (TPR) repeat protein
MSVLFALVLTLGVATAWFLVRATGARQGRILLVAPAPGPASGLDAFEAKALGALVEDHLECFGGYAVTLLAALPTNLEPLRTHPNTRVLVLEPRREGVVLALVLRSAPAGGLLQAGDRAWNRLQLSARPPVDVFQALDEHLGLAPASQTPLLAPRDAAAFWDLIRAQALRERNERLDEALSLAQRVVQEEPSCAAAWTLLGNLQYRRFLDDPQAFPSGESVVESPLRRALRLIPAYPRATFLLGLMKADAGDQREALDLLLAARRGQPTNPALLTGIAYAARGAGLLALAQRAIDLRDHLDFTEYLP